MKIVNNNESWEDDENNKLDDLVWSVQTQGVFLLIRSFLYFPTLLFVYYTISFFFFLYKFE